MQIDTAGTYTLKYTAEDSCGNITEIEREVEAVQISYRTVLYTDGTFIINEKSTDISSNIARHGEATHTYNFMSMTPYDGGAGYTFSQSKNRPWNSEVQLVTAVEIGVPIKPANTATWFSDMENCTRMDLSNLDTSIVRSMYAMFSGCRSLGVLDLSNFNTSSVENMSYMFNYTAFTNLILASFDTRNVKNMQSMFQNCRIDTLDISSFNSASLVDASYLFKRTTGQSIKTILTTDAFGVNNSPNIGSTTTAVFGECYDLVGGASTAWSLSHKDDWAYARIDNPPDAPGYFTAKTSA